MNIKRKATIFLATALFCLDAVCMIDSHLTNELQTLQTLRKFLVKSIGTSISATERLIGETEALKGYVLRITTLSQERVKLTDVTKAMIFGVKEHWDVVFINENGQNQATARDHNRTGDNKIFVVHTNKHFDQNEIAVETKACGSGLLSLYSDCVRLLTPGGPAGAASTFSTQYEEVKSAFTNTFSSVQAQPTPATLLPGVLEPTKLPSSAELPANPESLKSKCVTWLGKQLLEGLSYAHTHKSNDPVFRGTMITREHLAMFGGTAAVAAASGWLIGGLGTMITNVVPVIGPSCAPFVGSFLRWGTISLVSTTSCVAIHLLDHSGEYVLGLDTWLKKRQGYSLAGAGLSAITKGESDMVNSMWTGTK